MFIWSNTWLMWWIACSPNLLNLSEITFLSTGMSLLKNEPPNKRTHSILICNFFPSMNAKYWQCQTLCLLLDMDWLSSSLGLCHSSFTLIPTHSFSKAPEDRQGGSSSVFVDLTQFSLKICKRGWGESILMYFQKLIGFGWKEMSLC